MLKNGTASFHSRRTLRNRLRKSVRVEDLAREYPINWIEEVDAEGQLVAGPGLGERAIWMNHDCSVGSSLLVSGVDPYYDHEDHMASMQRHIAEVMLGMEFGEEIQFHWFPWHDHHRLIDRFAMTRGDDPPFKKWWHKNRAERDRRRISSGDLRTFCSLISLNLVADKNSRLLNPFGVHHGADQLWGALNRFTEYAGILKQNIDGLNREQYEALFLRMSKRMKSLERTLSSSAGNVFSLTPWRAADLFSFLRRMWATDEWEKDQIADGGSHRLPPMDVRFAPFAAYFLSGKGYDDHGDEFQVGDYFHRVLTMNTLPVMSDVGVLASALTDPQAVRGIKNIVMSMTCRAADKLKVEARLRTLNKHLTGQMQGNNEHGDNIDQIRVNEQRLKELKQSTRPTMFSAHYQIHLWEKDRELLRERELAVVSSLASSFELEVAREPYASFPFVLGFEQPGYTRFPDESRMIPLLPAEVAAIAPITACSDGCIKPFTSDPTARVPLLLETANEMPYGIDIFQLVNNFGGVFVGPAGSGKTNMAIRLMMASVNRNTDIVVIDGADQPGYETICRVFGGQYVNFDENFRINPLATVIEDGVQQNPTPDELADIQVTLGTMFAPGERLTPLETSVLLNAVRFVFEKRGSDPTRVTFTDLPRGLNPARFNDDPAQREIASRFSRIAQETWLTLYRDMVSGTEEIPHHWFTVFDVRNLGQAGKENLQALAMSYMFRYLDRLGRMNVARYGANKRYIDAYIDEAWKAARTPAMLKQIIAGYRTGRARGMSMKLLSQSMEDVLRLMQMGEDGKVLGQTESSPILENCSHVFLFKLGEAAAEQARRCFNLTQREKTTLMNLGGKDGAYREFVHILFPGGSRPRTFTRLLSRTTPEEYWATTTSSFEVGVRKELEIQVREAFARDPGMRKREIVRLREAGWEVETGIEDHSLVQSVVIHRLAHKLTQL